MPKVNIPDVGTIDFPDDMKPEDIVEAIKKLRADPNKIPVRAGEGSLRVPRRGRAAASRVLSAGPDIGGFVGGLVGGAATRTPQGAIGGAGLGGSLGEAGKSAGLRALGFDVPESSLQDIAIAGGTQGALEATGLGIGAAGSRIIAPRLQGKALQISPLSAGGRGSRQETAALADRAIKERVPVGGKKGQSGAEIAGEKAAVSGRKLTKILREAEDAGVTLKAKDLTDEVTRLIDDVREQPISTKDVKNIEKMLGQFLKENPGELTPFVVKRLKVRAFELAAPLLKKGKVRQGVTAKDALGGKFNLAIARSARKALEEIPERVPGSAEGRTFGKAIAEQEANTKGLIELGQATGRAESATSGITFQPFGPLRPFGALTPTARLSRPTISGIAQFLSSTAGKELARQNPRLISALVGQLGFEQPAETEATGSPPLNAEDLEAL